MYLLSHIMPLLAETSDRWSDAFFGLDQDQRFVLLIVVIGCATGVICTVVGCVSSTIASVHRRRLDHELKQELLDRGMNADEVAQVVEASPPNDFLERWANGSKKWGRRGGRPDV
jgi:hypothetical protein